MSKINKLELIDSVAEKEHLSIKDATAAVERLFSLMEAALLKGNEVNISNFGVLTPTVRKARKGTNPKSHNIIELKETTTICFRPSKKLKKKLNK